MKRNVAIILAGVLVAALWAGAVPAETKKSESIRIGYQTAHTTFVVANALGWFEEEFARDGIAFEARQFIAGPPIIEAFAGQRLDFGLVGDQPALLARAGNIDVKAVGVPLSGPRSLALLVPTGSTIKDVAELKGKKVAVTVGSVGHHLLYLLLDKAGLKPSDIQQVNLLPPDIKLALEQGNVDAGVTWEPFISIIEVEKIGRRLADGTGLKANVNVILASGAFTRDYPELTRRVLAIFLRAEKFVKENPEQAVAIAAKATGYKPEVLVRSIPNFDYDVRLTREIVDAVRQTAAYLRESGVLRKDVDVKDLVDDSFLVSLGAK